MPLLLVETDSMPTLIFTSPALRITMRVRHLRCPPGVTSRNQFLGPQQTTEPLDRIPEQGGCVVMIERLIPYLLQVSELRNDVQGPEIVTKSDFSVGWQRALNRQPATRRC
jgi:hypothetical protein